jgi:hypothetical protein
MRRILAPALLLAALLGARTAGAANFWFDFNHDGQLGTIQPRTAALVDTLSVVVDLTGLSLSAPFNLTWQSNQYYICFPNQTAGAVATIDTVAVSAAASVDSVWYYDSTGPSGPAVTSFGVRFKRLPDPGALVVLKLVLSYPTGENTPCPAAGLVDFTAGSAGGNTVGAPREVAIKDANVSVAHTTWGQLKRTYR